MVDFAGESFLSFSNASILVLSDATFSANLVIAFCKVVRAVLRMLNSSSEKSSKIELLTGLILSVLFLLLLTLLAAAAA